jgi:16S rRNA (uracil1498-N3)-methyltransferase
VAATVFYIDTLPGVGDVVNLDGPEGHHAATVRRIREGERLLLSDRVGGLADTVVEKVGKGRLVLRVLDRRSVVLPRPRVTLVQALPKSERAELAVELATEAGVDAIIPWQASRCVSRWDSAEKAAKGAEKWRAAALAAARQSRRAFVPVVTERHYLDNVVAEVMGTVARNGIAAALHESATARFTELPLAPAPEVLLIVGPEGGIDDKELDLLTAAGATLVVLGPTVLRTSTAAAVALGALGALTARWSQRPPH